jgi:hypothetical protein
LVTPWNCPTCGGLVKREAHPDGLIVAKAVAKEGYCIFCEEPLSWARRPRVICEQPGCKAAYHAAYNRDRRFRGLS